MAPSKMLPVRPGLDQELLLRMSEPLTIHVTRVRINSRETIPLPIRDGYTASGVGWTVDEVKNIEAEIIDISGGGTYEVQISDSQQDSLSQRYSFTIPLEHHPMRPPRTLASVSQGGYQPVFGSYTSPTPPAPPSGGYSTPPQGWNTPTQRQWQPPTPPPPDPTAALQAELHRRDLAMLETQHRHEMETLRQQISNARPRTDDRADRAERELAEARIRAAGEDQRRRDEENFRRLESQLAEDRRRADEKFAALMAQMAAMSARPSGPDPMITMMIESQRQAADAHREQARIDADASREAARLKAEVDKETARMQVEAARLNADGQNRIITELRAAMSASQVSPVEMARVMREASQGSDLVTKQMMGSVSDMLGIQQTFLSNLMQMSPQPEGVAGRVVGAIENIAERFASGQAQVETARANAVKAQAQAQHAAMTQPQAQPQPQAAPQAQPPAQPAPAGVAPPVTPPVAEAAASGPLGGTAPAVPAEPVSHAEAAGAARTDEQWFGPALPDVTKLREGVAVYLAALESEDVDLAELPGEPITLVDRATEQPIGVSPVFASKIIILAGNEIRKKSIPGVEAFSYLYEQEMYPALLDILLPNAPQGYRVDVVRYLGRLLNAEPLDQEDDAPMYGLERFIEEYDEEEDTGTNGVKPPPAVSSREGARR